MDEAWLNAHSLEMDEWFLDILIFFFEKMMTMIFFFFFFFFIENKLGMAECP